MQEKPLNEAVVGLEVQYQGQFDKALLKSIVEVTKKLLHDVNSEPDK